MINTRALFLATAVGTTLQLLRLPRAQGGRMIRRAAMTLSIVVVMSVSATAQDVCPIVSEAVIEAPEDSVWAAWSRSEGLRSWLAPHADIDLRIGGLIRANYAAEGKLGGPGTIENTILSYEPGRMLSIKVSRVPDGFPFPTAIRQMWTVMYFEPLAAGRTHVRVVSLGFTPDDESQRMRAFFDRGNAITLQQLQRRFPAPSQR